ncbi:Titin [Nymphon striatum]|nr:Titin [Nymphon striatum]
MHSDRRSSSEDYLVYRRSNNRTRIKGYFVFHVRYKVRLKMTRQMFSARRNTSTPDPPTNVKVTKYFNGTLTLAWNRPEYVGNIPILSYILQHKPRYKQWPEAKNISIDSRKFSTQLSNLKIGVKYDLRLLAVNSNGVSLPGPLVRFLPSVNGKYLRFLSVGAAIYCERPRTRPQGHHLKS